MPEAIASAPLFVNDARSIEEKLATLADLGSHSPEALTLDEIKILCCAVLRYTSTHKLSPPAPATGL